MHYLHPALWLCPQDLEKPVEWMVMAEFIRLYDKKIILIAPTTGLVAQQQRMAREMVNIDPESILRYTGETPPDKRIEIWNKGRILMATPQVIRNDATNGRISLDDVSLIIFDEAHHATGNHAYAQVGDLYLSQNPTGFTPLPQPVQVRIRRQF